MSERPRGYVNKTFKEAPFLQMGTNRKVNRRFQFRVEIRTRFAPVKCLREIQRDRLCEGEPLSGIPTAGEPGTTAPTTAGWS